MINADKIIKFEKIIKYTFKDKDNLKKALFHPSHYKEKKNKKLLVKNEFERLEFLGDRVLGLTIASLIFVKFKEFDEGYLSKKYSYLVQKNFLYKISLELNLDKFLIFSFNKNYRMNKSILSDSVESLIGSVFVDGGYNSAFQFINLFWKPYLDIQESIEQDPKTKLQELSQQKFKILPEYNLIKREGTPHEPTFTVSLKALKLNKIIASGDSKKEAEKEAAKKILKIFNDK